MSYFRSGYDGIGRHKFVVSCIRNNTVKWCKFRESLTDNADANPEPSYKQKCL